MPISVQFTGKRGLASDLNSNPTGKEAYVIMLVYLHSNEKNNNSKYYFATKLCYEFKMTKIKYDLFITYNWLHIYNIASLVENPCNKFYWFENENFD